MHPRDSAVSVIVALTRGYGASFLLCTNHSYRTYPAMRVSSLRSRREKPSSRRVVSVNPLPPLPEIGQEFGFFGHRRSLYSRAHPAQCMGLRGTTQVARAVRGPGPKQNKPRERERASGEPRTRYCDLRKVVLSVLLPMTPVFLQLPQISYTRSCT